MIVEDESRRQYKSNFNVAFFYFNLPINFTLPSINLEIRAIEYPREFGPIKYRYRKRVKFISHDCSHMHIRFNRVLTIGTPIWIIGFDIPR